MKEAGREEGAAAEGGSARSSVRRAVRRSAGRTEDARQSIRAAPFLQRAGTRRTRNQQRVSGAAARAERNRFHPARPSELGSKGSEERVFPQDGSSFVRPDSAREDFYRSARGRTRLLSLIFPRPSVPVGPVRLQDQDGTFVRPAARRPAG